MSPAAISTSASPAVQTIPLDYDAANPDASARRLLLALRPEWEAEPGPLEFVRFKDGITNTLFKAIKRRPDADEAQLDREAVLLRAYGNGTAVLIDREREAQSHSLLARYGLAPALLARFNNGLLYKFIAGDACTPADLRRPDVWPATASKLGEWHSMLPVAEAIATPGIRDLDKQDPMSLANANGHSKTNGHTNGHANGNGATPSADLKSLLPRQTPVPNLWTVLQSWIRALPARSQADRDRNKSLQAELEYATARLGPTPGLDRGAYIMCHCDLLSGNVIVHPGASHKDPSGNTVQTVSFIDYEYTTPGPAAFDLANHLSEWAGFECDYAALPTRSRRAAFVRAYVASYRARQRRALSNGAAAAQLDADAAALAAEVDEFRGMPGLYWGVWALIQAEISDIDFDYVSYAERRLGEYWGWKAGADNVRERRWAQEGE